MIGRWMVLAAVLFLVPACVGQKDGKPGPEFTIVTSFYPLYIMARNITRDIPGVRVVNLTQPGSGCLHDYQLTTADMKNLDGADVLIVNGAGLENFLDKVVRLKPRLPVIVASAGMKTIRSASGEDNPHLWVSVSNAELQVMNIAKGLSAGDSVHAGAYGRNARNYAARLETLRQTMHRALDGLPNRDVVTFHEAFPYFAREFRLNTIAVVEREPGSEPSAREMQQTIDLIRSRNARVIFAEPQYPRSAADAIARESGARVYILDPAVTGPDDPDAYIRIMEANLKVLREALGG